MIKSFIKILKKSEENIEVVETWIVEWTKRYGEYSTDTSKCYQAFTDKESADKLADSIRMAHKLIGNTSGTQVKVYKQNSGIQ